MPINMTMFKNNQPGKDFVKSFLSRHPQLAVRTGNNMKKTRAALSLADVNAFFDCFEFTAASVQQ